MRVRPGILHRIERDSVHRIGIWKPVKPKLYPDVRSWRTWANSAGSIGDPLLLVTVTSVGLGQSRTKVTRGALNVVNKTTTVGQHVVMRNRDRVGAPRRRNFLS